MVTHSTSENQSNEFETLLAQSIEKSNLKEGSIVKGTIVEIEDDAVVVCVNGKTEGRIPLREFSYQKDSKELVIGDVIEVVFERFENHNGECILSFSKAQSKVIWKEIKKSFENGELVEGVITGRVKGGLSCEVAGLNVFVPGSQVDLRPLRDISHLLNVPMMLRVLSMDERKQNIVVSRRAVIEETQKDIREKKFSEFALGDVVTGSVKAVLEYGCFIDLGGYDSLLHSSDITWKRIAHPSEVLSVGDELSLKIIKVDPEKNRVSVSLKAMQSDPWDEVSKKFKVGDKISNCRVSNVESYGIFVEIADGVEGLVHSSELSHSSKFNASPGQNFARSQSVDVVIQEIEVSRRRLSLSIKALTPSPYKNFNEKNPVGTILETEITNIKDGIIFCLLDSENELDGAISNRDLHWENDPKEEIKKYKVGDTISTKIISNDNAKISLSIREVNGNPFDELKNKTKGDVVTCNVLDVGDFGVKVRIGDNGPVTVIKKNELALSKSENRPNRFAKHDKLDAKLTSLDLSTYKVSLSIRALEEEEQKYAIENFGSADHGGSLGDILGRALNLKDPKK
tara:strand:- start:451 stop:2160 length:1710 start_codon:yes stop_codon:yes gene_type:complete